MAFIQFDPGVNVAPIAINEIEAKEDSNKMIMPWGRGLGQKQDMGENPMTQPSRSSPSRRESILIKDCPCSEDSSSSRGCRQGAVSLMPELRLGTQSKCKKSM